MTRLLTPELADQSLRLHHLLRTVDAAPLFDPELMASDPFVFDFTLGNPQVTGLVKAGGDIFQEYVDQAMADAGATWGVGQYLERRDGVLAGTYIDEQQRYYHLGVDIAFPKGTPMFAPLDGEVYCSGYADEWGDYGNYLATKHELDGITFYLMYGHLQSGSTPSEGPVKAGDQIGILGDFEENGQWFHHTHLQVCLLPWEEGTPDGYCTEANLDQYRLLNPNPLLLLREYLPSLLPAN